MPLLGTKIFQPAKPSVNVGKADKVYTINHTKEQFQSKGEYDKRCALYKEPVWTCQCTGQIKLTHVEAWKSEQEVYKQIKEQFPKYCEKPVLEFVHHSTDRLEELMMKTWTALHQAYMVGEPVRLKVRAHGKPITGKIIKIDRSGIEVATVNNCNSPSSDKENKGQDSGSGEAASPRKIQPKILPYKYAMKLDHDDKIISGIPANDIERIHRPPSKDVMRLFIRANAVRFGVQSSSPWLVDEVLVKKYNIPSKFPDCQVSPQKVAELSKKAEEEVLKKRKSAGKLSESPVKKRKLNKTSKDKVKDKKSPRKQMTLAFSKKTPKKQTVVSLDSDSDSSDDDIALADVKKRLDSCSSDEEDISLAKLKKRQREQSCDASSSDSDLVLAKVVKKLKASPTKRKMSPAKLQRKNKRTPSKLKKKNELTPKKGSTKKDSVTKVSSKKKDATKLKKGMKQMTLFELSKQLKAGAKSPRTPSKSPRKSAPTPPRTPRIVGKVRKAMKDNNRGRMIQFAIQAAKELNAKQRANLPDDVKGEILKRFEKIEEKKKLNKMTPEEREAYLEKQREEQKEQRRKIRMAQNKRYEDTELDLKPFPSPTLVSTPDGLPNECFGDVTLVTEFISCFKTLLMPDDKEPVTPEFLMKGLCSGADGFAAVSRVLAILLQTLLQDEISEDYKEFKCPLTEIPVKSHTTSELLRLVLRKHDSDHVSDEGCDSEDEAEQDIDDVSEELLEQLETTEFYEFEPKQKLEFFKCLCHRIMGSYSVQDYMEEKQKDMSRLWRQKLAQYKENKENKKNVKEAKKDDGGKEPTSTDGQPDPQNALTLSNFYGKEVTEQAEDSDDLASVVKRRRMTSAKAAMEKEKRQKEERLRREKEYNAYKKQKELEQFEKDFEEGLVMSKLCLRQHSIGSDRHHSRYWIFEEGTPGVYIEKGWANKDINYSLRNSEDSDSDEEMSQMRKEDPMERTFPHCGQNLWFTYSTIEEIDALIAALNPRGIRESQLLTELKKRYVDIVKKINTAEKRAPKEKEDREVDGQVDLLTTFREELLETEVKLRNGGLGGVDSMENWGQKLMTSSDRKALGECLIEVQATVQEKFREGFMAKKKVKPKMTKDDETGEQAIKEAEEDKVPEGVTKWTEAVVSAQTMSRLHVLLGMLDACIKWEKSAENAKCKICRRKQTNDELLLCDECNQPFHLWCLRPAMLEVPKGDWFCPACVPQSQRRMRTRDIKRRPYRDDGSSAEDASSDETVIDDDATEVEHEDNCAMCGGDEGLILCSTCPNAFHLDCHDPPLRHPPRGRWECNPCRTGVKLRKTKKPIEARRGRGRPPQRKAAQKKAKSSSEESDSSEEEEEEEDEEEVVQPATRRGRPSRRPTRYEHESSSDDEEEEEDDEEEAQPCRSRARPASSRTRRRKQSTSEEEYSPKSQTRRSGSGRRTSAPKKQPPVNNMHLEEITNRILRHRSSWPFREAVDIAEVPDYYDIIANPIDLETIKDRCASNAYQTCDSYVDDMTMLFNNAQEYNKKESDIYQCMITLEKYFIDLLQRFVHGYHYEREFLPFSRKGRKCE
ncbi:tyrosine-protein kinase BAZ1B-like [Lineus longissimus]|uniref:tyrosine-protein kinase BAZ1B-like n=1 Tax=Lineus longissimus TaxID=88925 RepID=UPI002B4F5BB0